MVLLTDKEMEKIRTEVKLEFKDKGAKREYKKAVLMYSFGRSNRRLADFLVFWPKCMQYLMNEKNMSVAECANESFFQCVRECMINPDMFENAIDILGKTWKHGDDLKAWNVARQNKNKEKTL